MNTAISWAQVGKKRQAWRRRVIRQRVWKSLNIVVAVTTLLNVSAIGTFLAPQAANASGAASIWTTRTSCVAPDPQDENEYANSDWVQVRGKNFIANKEYFGTVMGNPGGSSADPGEVVKTFSTTTDANGIFCVAAYQVGSDGDLDDGVYTVDVYDNADFEGSSKNDNYHVNAVVGSLTVNKVVDSGSASADSFSFTLRPDPYGVGTFSTTNGSVSFSNLPVGNYTVSENAMTGYHEVSNDCNLTVVNGQNASCTVHNARDTRQVTIVKEVVGGNAQPSDWTFGLSNDEASYSGIQSGVPVTVFTGAYGLSESGPSGYTMSGVSGNCYNDGGFFLTTNSEGSTCTVTNTFNPSAPSLTISKTDNRVTAQPGETLTYEVTVANSGDQTAFGVMVDDTLPSFLGTPSDISDSGSFSAGHVVWNNLVVPGHGSKVVSFKAMINSSMPVGTTVLHNVADLGCSPLLEVDFLQFQCQYSGQATDDTSVTVAPPPVIIVPVVVPPVIIQPTLSITKTNSLTTFTSPGTTVVYTIVVRNFASATLAATNVVMIDVLPTGFTFTGGATTKTYHLGDIAPGASVTSTETVGISAAQTTGVYTNTATAKGDNASQVTATSNVEVRVPQVLGAATPDLTITKTVNPTETTPGQVIDYTVTVKNDGGDASNVVVTDELPVGFTYVDGGGSSKTWTFSRLAGGASQVITYKVKVGSDVTAGNYVNRAFVLADGADPISAQATVTVRVPQVLGLATTGVSARDYATFGLGLIMLAAGFIGLNRRRRDPEVQTE